MMDSPSNQSVARGGATGTPWLKAQWGGEGHYQPTKMVAGLRDLHAQSKCRPATCHTPLNACMQGTLLNTRILCWAGSMGQAPLWITTKHASASRRFSLKKTGQSPARHGAQSVLSAHQTTDSPPCLCNKYIAPNMELSCGWDHQAKSFLGHSRRRVTTARRVP